MIENSFFKIEKPGLIRISGVDRTSFIQRQTTNDIDQLVEGKTLTTVLTTPEARILDVFYLLQTQNAIECICLPGRIDETFAYLKSRVFFMDKVNLDNMSGEYCQFELIGSQLEPCVQILGFERLPNPGEIATSIKGTKEAFLISTGYLERVIYRLVTTTAWMIAENVENILKSTGLRQLTPAEYQTRRIELGVPGEMELNRDYTPYEVGLQAAVSSKKGCYTGQEVLARQVTYDKVTQKLCGLKMSSMVQPGDRLWVEGRSVGTITSVALSPEFGPIGLGVVKRPHQSPGTKMAVGVKKGSIEAVIYPIPFTF